MKILGLDLGTSSVGWALVDIDTQYIVDMGVRIFPEGVENIGQGEKEASKSVSRRLARGIRKQYDRKQLRKRKLKSWLKEHLYWPPSPEEYAKFTQLDPYKLRVDGLDRILSKEELSRVLYHLIQRRGFFSKGRSKDTGTIYKGKPESGMVGIEEMNWQDDKNNRTYGEYLVKNPDAAAKKRKRYTLRAWLKEEYDKIIEKQKEGYPALFSEAVQQALRDDVVFFQRDLKIQEALIGKCLFEPNEPRMKKSNPMAQIFTIYNQLTNLSFSHRIETRAVKKFVELEEGIKEKLIYALHTKKDLSIDEVKKIVLKKGLLINYQDEYGETKQQVIKNLEELASSNDYHKKLTGSPFIAFFLKETKQAFRKEDRESYAFIRAEALLAYEKMETASREEFSEWLIQRHPNINKAIAANLFDNSPEPIGTISLSKKAVENILSFMIQGKRYDQAIQQAGYKADNYLSDSDKKIDKVVFHIDRRIDRENSKSLTYGCIMVDGTAVRNPVVSRTLFEMAKVVNSVIKHYGKPDRIHLELAREMSLSPAKRQELINTQKANEEMNNKARGVLEKEFNLSFATKSQLIKYRLWEEQNRTCVYSGRKIQSKDLFNNTLVQIDHIVPQGATGGSDDSYLNKVLCFAEENSSKGMQLPFEWLSKVRFTKMKDIVASFGDKYPASKQRRLFATSIEELPQSKDFAQKMLNDTRSATRYALKLLKPVTNDRSTEGVIPMNGKLTSGLRNNWFPGKNEGGRNHPFIYNSVLEDAGLLPSEWGEGDKSRLDHRHHALDALVLALSTRSDVQKAAHKQFRKEKPWKGIEKQVKDLLDAMIVSYRVDKKVNGSLHNEKLYGRIQLPVDKELTKIFDPAKPVSVIRKSLSSLTDKDLTRIIDGEVRLRIYTAIKEEARRLQMPEWEAGNTPPKDWYKKEILHKNGHKILKVRVALNEPGHKQIRKESYQSHKPYKKGPWVALEGNHHSIVYKNINGKQSGETVQIFNMALRKAENKPAILPQPKEDEVFLFSLRKNELVCFDISRDELLSFIKQKKHYKSIWKKVYRVQKVHSEGTGTYRHHSLAKIDYKTIKKEKDDSVGRKLPNFGSLNAIKLHVDPAGFLTLSNE